MASASAFLHNYGGSEGTTNDAADYVEAIMSSQQVTRVGTPVQTGRKRNASDPCTKDSSVKKARITDKAKRALYNGSSHVTTLDTCDTGTGLSVEHMLAQLSADIHMQFSAMNERMDKLESGLEQRISTKVAQLLDKRVNSELNRIRKDVEDKMESLKDDIRADISSDLYDINEKLRKLSNVPPALNHSDLSLNIVIRNLPESNKENTTHKVNTLIRNGLKITNVCCVSAERKSTQNGRSGLVIAKFKSHEDKRKVRDAKKYLKGNHQYAHIFINHDQLYADRLMTSNFRNILNVIQSDELSMKGSRVVFSRQENINNGEQRHRNINQNSNGHNLDRQINTDRDENHVGWNRVGSKGRNNRGGNRGRGSQGGGNRRH